MKKILVLGAGAMGSAFTVPCMDNNNNVVLVGTHLEDKTIENLNIRTTLLNSEFRKVVLEIIDKSILLHAPFLKKKNNMVVHRHVALLDFQN